MWLLPLIEKLNIGTMTEMGLKLSAEDIYSRITSYNVCYTKLLRKLLNHAFYHNCSLAATELHEVGLYELIQVAVEDRLGVTCLISCAKVFHQLIRMKGV